MVCLIEREREKGNGLNIDYSILMLDSAHWSLVLAADLVMGQHENTFMLPCFYGMPSLVVRIHHRII